MATLTDNPESVKSYPRLTTALRSFTKLSLSSSIDPFSNYLDPILISKKRAQTSTSRCVRQSFLTLTGIRKHLLTLVSDEKVVRNFDELLSRFFESCQLLIGRESANLEETEILCVLLVFVHIGAQFLKLNDEGVPMNQIIGHFSLKRLQAKISNILGGIGASDPASAWNLVQTRLQALLFFDSIASHTLTSKKLVDLMRMFRNAVRNDQQASTSQTPTSEDIEAQHEYLICCNRDKYNLPQEKERNPYKTSKDFLKEAAAYLYDSIFAPACDLSWDSTYPMSQSNGATAATDALT
ncbi:unnamed protein product [Protopolystoma xenopodis]|uniref:Uncharacterized protein n=1 Tax=Protopolystoma xenopodis TaxID=117903 RepID=A0A3S5CPS8_9PLAT|nr:unnamed protein product [Protopolystoma xenopodis]